MAAPWEKYAGSDDAGASPKPWEAYGAAKDEAKFEERKAKTGATPVEKPTWSTGGRGGEGAVVAEPLLNMATGMIAKPVSDVAGLAALGKELVKPSGGSPEDFRKYVRESLTYQPKTKAGEAVAEYNPLALLGKAVGWGAGKIGEGLRGDAPSNTARGGIGNAVEEAINQAPGFVGAKAGKAAAERLPAKQAALDIAKGENAPKDAVRAQSQAAGLTTPPEGTSWLSSLPGMAKVEKWISEKNAPQFVNLMRQQMGIPAGVALTADELGNVRRQAYGSYEKLVKSAEGKEVTETPAPRVENSAVLDASGKPITREIASPPITRKQGLPVTPEFKAAMNDQLAKLEAKMNESPQTFKFGGAARLLREYAGKTEMTPQVAMDAIKQLRSDAGTLFKSDNPAKVAEAFTRKEVANQIEGLFEANLQKTGNTQLLQEFRDARKKIAQSYDIEAALKPDGQIDARKLATISQKRPLSENLKLVADFAGTYPKAAQKVTEAKQPFSIFDLMFAGGAMAAGHPGLAAGELAGRVGIPWLAQRGTLSAGAPFYRPSAFDQALPGALPFAGAAISQPPPGAPPRQQ